MRAEESGRGAVTHNLVHDSYLVVGAERRNTDWCRVMKSLIALIVLLSASCVAQSHSSSFDDEHAKGVRQNPPGAMLTISTSDGRSTYRLSDVIRFKLALSSNENGVYTYEAITGMSVAGTSDDLIVLAPGKLAPIHSRSRAPYGIVCCDSRRHYLAEKPSIATFSIPLGMLQRTSPLPRPDFSIAYELTPGEYRVFVQTRRVLRGYPKSRDEMFKSDGLTVTSSNVLSLTILPDGAAHGTPTK